MSIADRLQSVQQAVLEVTPAWKFDLMADQLWRLVLVVPKQQHKRNNSFQPAIIQAVCLT